MFSTINLRRISHEEFLNLKAGDIVYLKIGKHTFQSKVVREAFYNYDAEEWGWEVETDNGYCDEYSVYVKKWKF